MAEHDTPVDPGRPDYLPPWIDPVEPATAPPAAPAVDSEACEREYGHVLATRHRRAECPVDALLDHEAECERAFMARSPDHRAAL